MALPLTQKIESLAQETRDKISACKSMKDLDAIQVEILGKKGQLTGILKGLKDLSPEEKKTAGQVANQVRTDLESSLSGKRVELEALELEKRIEEEKYDALRPLLFQKGGLHPISEVQYRTEDIFRTMGFQIMDGPEVETDSNNFGNLNFSDDHPARDMHDTFWLEDGNLLRTHTSSVQARAMETLRPPFRILAPGRVFRQEETDASHETTFYQVEGMLVDRKVSVAHLIHVMKSFLSAFLEKDVEVRLRPGYFPFVEPGFELDFRCLVCGGDGCPVCKHSGWVEVMPCGLVHPNVLRSGGIDPDEWQGFAFGMGLNRLVMMRYGIDDIRHFMSGNIRFLNQF